MLGGVARNIAECLLKLGTKSFLISALGCDLAGSALLCLLKVHLEFLEIVFTQLPFLNPALDYWCFCCVLDEAMFLKVLALSKSLSYY